MTYILLFLNMIPFSISSTYGYHDAFLCKETKMADLFNLLTSIFRRQQNQESQEHVVVAVHWVFSAVFSFGDIQSGWQHFSDLSSTT